MKLTWVRCDINNLLSFFFLLVGVLRMLTFKYVSVVRALVSFHFGWSWEIMMWNIYSMLSFFHFSLSLFLNSNRIFLKFILFFLFVVFLWEIDVKHLFLLKHHWVGIVFLPNVSTTRFSHAFLVRRKFIKDWLCCV